MKFAQNRQQYNRAQQAMIANEDIIKGMRRQLTAHMKEVTPLLEGCLPAVTAPWQLKIVMPHDNARSGAAYQSFAIQVKGMTSWHDPSPKDLKALRAVMKPHGWTGEFHRSATHWWLNFV